MKEAKAGSAFVGRGGKAGAAAGGSLAAIRSWPDQTKAFLGEVRSEVKRVTWPSKQQIRATTIVVIVTVFLFGAYFAILDQVFRSAVGYIFRLWG